jgi:uncharacterized protein YfiM (DUF2279 family)
MRRSQVILLAVAMLLVGAGAGGAAGRTIRIVRGNAAEFPVRSGDWICANRGTYVGCQGGDALPRASLGVDPVVASLRVFSLDKPCIRRIHRPSPDPKDPQMRPYWEYVYTFKAFGCR